MDVLSETVLLSVVPGIGPVRSAAMLASPEFRGRLDEVSADEIVQAGLTADLAAEIIRARDLRLHERELERADELGVRVLTPDSAGFPQPLREIRPVPPLLYVRGSLTESAGDDALAQSTRPAPALAIVGARRCTPYGRSRASALARDLAAIGVTIVSGLARGIDTAAHLGALDAGGRTVAVLGCGVNIDYPLENRGLARRIAEGGAVLSEFPLDVPPIPQNFPQRNRIISGLSAGVVVVQATMKSGSLITANWALDQGRDVFAVPGNVDRRLSQGPHCLIREGARLIETADDIIEECKEIRTMKQQGTQAVTGRTSGVDIRVEALGPRERKVFDMLSTEPAHIDRLVEQSGLPVSVVSAILTLLEMKGITRQMPGKWFVIGDGYVSSQPAALE